MRNDPLALYDGFSTVRRGVNSGLAPIDLGRDQLAWAINTTCRNNFPTCRPGFVKRPLAFLNSNGTTDVDLTTNFQTGIFQGATSFERRNQLVTMIGGRLFRVSLDNWNVLDVSTTDLNPSNRYRAWFAEAEDFIIAQDGQSAAWIYDGATTKRSDAFGLNGGKQVPTGTAMVYSQGRLIVSLLDNRQFVVGDIVNGESGTATYAYRDAVLYFTENDIINGGGAFSVPISAGALTAFRPIAQVDTSTGQGPTQVFTTGGIFSLNTPNDRTQWANTNFPIGTVSMVSAGALSDRATINVNGDIWMRSLDGVRSFIVARRDFTSWVNAPMSREVERALDRDDKALLSFASSALFDNRLLTTCNPYRVWNSGVAHRGLAVIDFAPLAYLSTRTAPVWEGIWTGLRVLQILSGTFNGVERCFVFALSTANTIELWELTRDRADDYNGVLNVPITWSMESGALTFPRSINQNPSSPSQLLSSLDAGRLYTDELTGNLTFTTDYRPDQDQCWHHWHSWTACATTSLCTALSDTACVTPGNYQQQYRTPFFLPTPPVACDESVNKPTNKGREFQVRLTVTGHARIKRFEAIAHEQQEAINGLCAGSESCKSVTCCSDNDFTLYQLSLETPGTRGSDSPHPPPPVTPPDDPPPPPVDPPVDPESIPVQCDASDPACWVNNYTGPYYISSYGVTKVTDDPYADGVTADMAAFWMTLLTNEYGGSLTPNGVFAWGSIDPYSAYIGDFDDKFATGDPVPHEGDPLFAPGAFWRLTYLSPTPE